MVLVWSSKRAVLNNQELVSRIIKLIIELDLLPADFMFSSIQILRSATVRPHKDANTGVSVIFTTGNFTGGELIVAGKVAPTFRQRFTFDGQSIHYVAPFSGERWSVTLYQHGCVSDTSSADRALLSSLGFRVPTVSPNPEGLLWKDQPRSSQRRRLALLECSCVLSEFFVAAQSFGEVTNHFTCEVSRTDSPNAKRLDPKVVEISGAREGRNESDSREKKNLSQLFFFGVDLYIELGTISDSPSSCQL